MCYNCGQKAAAPNDDRCLPDIIHSSKCSYSKYYNNNATRHKSSAALAEYLEQTEREEREKLIASAQLFRDANGPT